MTAPIIRAIRVAIAAPIAPRFAAYMNIAFPQILTTFISSDIFREIILSP